MIRALAIALAVLALLPQAASAHALLKATVPERGERLEAAPEQVTLRFSEPVEAEFGAVRVFDSGGREVQAGRAFHPEGRAAEIAVRLRDGLADDGYTVTYRVVSADSHPVSGGFVFVVGDAAAPATTVGDLLGDDGTATWTGTAFGVARATQFAAIALGLGALIFTSCRARRSAWPATGRSKLPRGCPILTSFERNFWCGFPDRRPSVLACMA